MKLATAQRLEGAAGTIVTWGSGGQVGQAQILDAYAVGKANVFIGRTTDGDTEVMVTGASREPVEVTSLAMRLAGGTDLRLPVGEQLQAMAIGLTALRRHLREGGQ